RLARGRRRAPVHVALDEAVREADGGRALEVAHDARRRPPGLAQEEAGRETADLALLDADRRVVGEPDVVERRQANPDVDVARVAAAVLSDAVGPRPSSRVVSP